MFDQPQPTPEEIAQRLRLMDFRLEQRYPGYLAMLEQLREPRSCVRDDGWSPTTTQRHACQYGSDNNERTQP